MRDKTRPLRLAKMGQTKVASLHACVCADGTHCPTFLLFAARKNQEMETPVLVDVQDTNIVAKFTSSGYQTKESFWFWFDHVFVPYCDEKRSHDEWVLLILDNHYSHTVEPADVKRINQQRIVFWYPPTNTTQHTMPLDVKLFGPLKRISYRIRREKYDECEDYKKQVGPLTQQMVDQAFKKDTIRKAFVEPGYVDEDASDNSLASVSPQKLIDATKPLCDLNTRITEGGDDTPAGSLIHPDDPLRKKKLEERLDKFRLKKIAALYRKAFINGSLSIPSLQLNAGSVADEIYAADVENLQEFFKADKEAKEEEKRQKKVEEKRKKAELALEKEQKRKDNEERRALGRAERMNEKELIQEHRAMRSKLRKADNELIESQKTIRSLTKQIRSLKRKLDCVEGKYERLKKKGTKSVTAENMDEKM